MQSICKDNALTAFNKSLSTLFPYRLRPTWQRRALFILSFVLVHIAVSFLFTLLSRLTTQGTILKSFLEFDSIYEEFVIVVVAAPILETLIFQYSVFDYGKKWISKEWVLIVISAIIFSLGHCYNIIYFLNALVAGLIFGYAYFKAKQLGFRPFISVWLIHSLYNLFVFVFNHTPN